MEPISVNKAVEIIQQLSDDDQHRLLAILQEQLEPKGDWALQGKQLAFMLQHHDEIELAYAGEDMEALDKLESSTEYKALFGDMPWDEAYDRYEETWWVDDDDA
jgi:hypothetical protein